MNSVLIVYKMAQKPYIRVGDILYLDFDVFIPELNFLFKVVFRKTLFGAK